MGDAPGQVGPVRLRTDLAAVEQRFLELTRVPHWQFWKREARDSELRTSLTRIALKIGEAQGILDRLESDQGSPSRTDTHLERFRAEAGRLIAVTRSPLGGQAALALIGKWDDVLAEYGDETYICKQLEDAYARAARADHSRPNVYTWLSAFGVDGKIVPEPVWEQFCRGETVKDQDLRQARNKLRAFYATRADLYGLDRSRIEMKAQYLWWFTPVVLLLVLALGAAVILASHHPTSISRLAFLAASAGAIGGSLSGAFKLRDELLFISEIRAFAPGIILQPLIGAVAGLFALLVLKSGIIDVNIGGKKWATYGVIAFAAGFSEPFLLKLVSRVAAIPPSPAKK